MTKIIPFPKSKRGKKRAMSVTEYLETLDVVESLVEEVYIDRLEDVRKIINEMRFTAHFNHKFREQTADELQILLENLYAKSQGEE